MNIKRTKNSKQVWLASPYMHQEEKDYVKEAFDKNWITTAGDNLVELEKMVCEYAGAKCSVSLSSGTAALHLAMIDAGVKPGDRVFSTNMTFAATCNPIRYQCAEPIFIDEEPETWNMDPQLLEEGFKKYPDVKVCVVANLYGVPAKLDEIKAVCDKYGATLIEDAAESLGAEYKGKQTGTFGDIGVISFNGNKIVTGSTGGMIVTDNEEAAEHIKKLSTQAREPFAWYQHEEIGYNYRMSNIVAGVARGQFEHLDEHIAGKKAIFDRYEAGLSDLPIKMHGGGNYWLSCMLVEGVEPAKIIAALKEYNIEARHIWKPMSMQPVFAGCEMIGGEVGKKIFETGLCLPSDLNMTEEEQQDAIEIIRSCF